VEDNERRPDAILSSYEGDESGHSEESHVLLLPGTVPNSLYGNSALTMQPSFKDSAPAVLLRYGRGRESLVIICRDGLASTRKVSEKRGIVDG